MEKIISDSVEFDLERWIIFCRFGWSKMLSPSPFAYYDPKKKKKSLRSWPSSIWNKAILPLLETMKILMWSSMLKVTKLKLWSYYITTDIVKDEEFNIYAPWFLPICICSGSLVASDRNLTRTILYNSRNAARPQG